jgi:hypothetical protein
MQENGKIFDEITYLLTDGLDPIQFTWPGIGEISAQPTPTNRMCFSIC